MTTCYNCGKLILGKKIMGLCANEMHTFCSDRCRSAAWSNGRPKVDSNSDGNYISAPKETVQEEKGISTLSIDGAEFEYSAKTAGVTIIIKKLENKSSWKTGKLRLELFLSKSGPYKKGTSLSGTTLAISNSYDCLRKNYSYTNMKTTAHIYEKPKSGIYTPVLLVREYCDDGEWHIAGYVNFSSNFKWS